jgi:putative membrane protein
MSKLHTYTISILLLFHAIGIYLFLNTPDAASLTYVNMSLCATVLFIAQDQRKVLPLIIIALGGFAIEWVGVHTGVLFGEYDYGASLGYKALGIPIVIGLNWYCVVLSSVSISNYLTVNKVVKAVIAALLCTFLDFLIEPIAIRYDFWSWGGNEIPIYNYVCWFGFSFIFALLYLRYSAKPNKTATALFFIWLVFFTLLNLI